MISDHLYSLRNARVIRYLEFGEFVCEITTELLYQQNIHLQSRRSPKIINNFAGGPGAAAPLPHR